MAFLGSNNSSFMPMTISKFPTSNPCQIKPLIIKCDARESSKPSSGKTTQIDGIVIRFKSKATARKRSKPSSGKTPPQINSVVMGIMKSTEFGHEVVIDPISLNFDKDNKKVEVDAAAAALKNKATE
ncbi:uncharacterized protein LOC131176994 [Hevea brasiliensis]|uniref:uncharacterized protein LOC131176994 n=1 Tax=Hevea brasiliensis TaxID=3981 RepID=UPI0025E5A5DD|nr:uncharacterized protein LOC131176994 [Hevea brasiliensis]